MDEKYRDNYKRTVFWVIVYFGDSHAFRWNISPPSSGSKSKLSNAAAEAGGFATFNAKYPERDV
jgi:hypothetical protein